MAVKDLESTETIRIWNKKTEPKVREFIEDDEFSFVKVRVDNKRIKYDVPVDGEDEDDTESVSTFQAVILNARKSSYLSEEDKAKGKEPRVQRHLVILRTDQLIPEEIYVNPSSINRQWKPFLKVLKDDGQMYHHVVCEFSLEKASYNGYKWARFNFKKVRTLTPEEQEFIEEMQELVKPKLSRYEEQSVLDDIEDEMLGDTNEKTSDDEDEDDFDTMKKAKSKKPKIEEDEEEEKPKSRKTRKKPDPEPEPSSDDDDEDEEEDLSSMKNKRRRKKFEEDEEEDED